MKIKNNNLVKLQKLLLILLFTILLIDFIFILSSCEKEDEGFILPEYSGFVNDYTGKISSEWLDKIELVVRNVEEETSCEIGVAVIDSLDGNTIEDYAAGLFEKWGIGKQDQDNGILLLVSIEDRELRLEVGYGLEGTITDIEAGNIINNIIVPRFKENNYEVGIYNGVIAVSNEINSDYGKNLLAYSSDYSSVAEISFSETKAFGRMIMAIVISVNILPWLILGLLMGIPALKYYISNKRCPKCKKLKLKTNRMTLEKPSYISSGRVQETRSCSYCGFSETYVIVIPQLQKYISGSGGSGGSGISSSGSSFSSSGSSHSSSSSGFGGGSSGGGGASGSW